MHLSRLVFPVLTMKSKISYTGIRVKNLDDSVEFYIKILGMKETGRSKNEATKGQNVSLVSDDGGPTLELNYYEKGSRFDSPYVVGEGLDHIAFQVEDLDKFKAASEKAGHPLILDMKTDTSRWAYIQDPNGIWIEIFS